jgi:hypothetical protein
MNQMLMLMASGRLVAEELLIKELIIADMSGLTIQEHKVAAMMLLSVH